MRFRELSECYSKLESTQKKLEMVDILANTLSKASNEEIGKIALLTLGKIYPDFVGIELMLAEKMAIKALAVATGKNEKSVAQIVEEVGDLGKTTQTLLEKKSQSTLLSFTTQKDDTEYEIIDVWTKLDSIAQTKGEGSSDKKIRILSGLISKVSPLEARFITRMVVGQLRLGVAVQLLLEALSKAKTGTREKKNILERAYNLTSDISFISEKLYKEGIQSVEEIKVQIMNPIKVMLAQRVSSADEILEKFEGKVSLEYKYDGLRVQIHKKADKVKLFSRRPEDITEQFPDVIEFIKESAEQEDFIIEGEIVAFDLKNEKILPFQYVSQRKRKHDIEQKISEIPVRVYLFDALFAENRVFLDEDYLQRREILFKVIKETENIRFSHQIIAENTDEIDDFFHQALENSCEGVMGKSVGQNSVYQAGARGWNWVKYKADYVDKLSDSFDLVILGAEYGKGKRAGKYGTFLLGCFDVEESIYQTFTRVATGFSDDDLAYYFKLLKPLAREKPKEVLSDIDCSVWFDPRIVIEVTGAEITRSQMHTCSRGYFENENDGLALRFPRFTGKLVDDRPPEQATSNEEIRTIYLKQ
ncbi:MAG: ATP-dependent DNA ligase [Candidatus Heimdallarchaeota archaeon]|nr:ATP-dependent DNA ligase [Candidatus Heimdallarchaeota archaeon]